MMLILCGILLIHISSSSSVILRRDKHGMLGEPPEPKVKYHLPPDEWFTQVLDHFSPTNNVTWQQRYFTVTDYFKAGGPVFLMIGGEGEASPLWMVNGAWIDYAQMYGALCFQLEHRYYGKSHPTEDLSTDNLKYLSSEQALADLAYFISVMNEKYKLPKETKWIVFGGSYPGCLAAWLRFKYPHLVHGAMSASGPLLAKVDFKEYFEVVTSSLATYGKKCVKSIKAANHQIDLLLKHPLGQKAVNKKFNLCDAIDVSNKNDVSNFMETLADNFAGVVQYNKDNRAFKKSPGWNITIDIVCDIMTNESIGSAVDRLAAVNTLLLKTYEESCLDYKYDKMIKEMKNSSWEGPASSGGRQWMYQTCTEFGFYQTSSKKQQLFGSHFPIDFFVQQCSDIYGDKFTADLLKQAVTRSNIIYGGLDIQIDRVVYVHGSIDPWHALGITKTLSPDAPAIYIKGTAHCANMYPPSENDLPQLKDARKQISSLIGEWLAI